jgi:malonate-semialdehyde dehydrogenase (acetylating)/methylmalonate-semialdehyde dehydrogenase
VFNVVNGDRRTVDALLAHRDVRAVSFVGSTAVAARLYELSARHGKRVQALGGAKNHAIVAPDADVEASADAIMGAAYGSCGERCMAISVAVCVGDAIAERLNDALKSRIASMRLGPWHDPESEMGPLISVQHRERVCELIASGEAEGASLLVDGRDHPMAQGGGAFLGPTLFDHVSPVMRLYREEIFGPVLAVVRVQSFAEALELVNGHEFGNGSCLFTKQGAIAREFVERVQVGMVGVNVPLPVPVATHSFGGWKRSLFGDLHAYGPDSVAFYTRRKTVSERWPRSGTGSPADFAFPG